MSTPVPITATVTPPPTSAPRCAAASQPRARPLMTITPAFARSAASCSATASPYGEGRREPTIATRGPSGGGHLPRACSAKMTGGNVIQPIAQRLENVAVADELRALEVGRSACDAPGPVEAARGEALPLRPALERESRARLQCRDLSKPAGLELAVQASLPLELAGSRGLDPLPHGC